MPKDASRQFPEFFKALDQNLDDLKIDSYGVSMTTLEEVFLSVESGGKKEKEVIEEIKKRLSSNLNERNEDEKDYSIAKEQIHGT